jgi:1-acyl-sn-glycerol-3-phosphate acyltransferase
MPAEIADVPLRPESDRLYRAARAVIASVMRIFFRRLEIRGGEHIPATGPLLLAANHPSGIVDSFSVGLATSRKVHFVARSTLFANPQLAKLLTRLGVIPIYRKMDAATEMGRNADVFRHCYELLAAGGVIGIFPEGITHDDPQVKEMRTGAMRIGLGAEAGRDFELGVRVVPVGINQSKPGAGRGELVLRVGAPIVLSRHAAAYRADPVATALALTAELRARIESLVVHLDDVAKAPIVDAAFDVFGAGWLADPRVLPEIGDPATRRIELTRAIAQAIEYYSRYQPVWALDVARRVAAYRAALERLRISDEMLHRRVGALPLLRQTLPVAIVGVLGAPLAGFGWLLNRLPRLVTRRLSKRFAPGAPQLALYEMGIGLPAFAASYAAAIALLHRYSPLDRSELALAMLLFPVIGFLSNRWFALIRHYGENLRITSLHLLRRGRLEQLRFARQQLERDQQKMRSFFLEQPPTEDASA